MTTFIMLFEQLTGKKIVATEPFKGVGLAEAVSLTLIAAVGGSLLFLYTYYQFI